MANTHDWLSDISARTRKAYRPDPFAGILQSLKQGFIGKKITEDKLREAMMTMMMGTHTPMVGETPATPEQITGAIRGKPGVIPSLFGAKPPEELTWKPLPTEWKATTKEEKLEEIRAKGEASEALIELKGDLAKEKYANDLAIERLKSELKGAKNQAEIDNLNSQIRERDEKMRKMKILNDEFEKVSEKGYGFGKAISDVLRAGVRALGITPSVPGKTTPETPLGQIELGLEETPPTETLIPDWLPEEVKARVRTLQEAGASQEEIQAVIDYYRQ